MEDATKPTFKSSWEVRRDAGEPVAVVRVRNLQAMTRRGEDAWGRDGKPKPLLVSAELSFREPFGAAASRDTVTAGDTVHYGTLCKAILDCLEAMDADHVETIQRDAAEGDRWTTVFDLDTVLGGVWQSLTGTRLPDNHMRETWPQFLRLDLSTLRFMSLTVCLPKASLLGQGVSMMGSAVFEDGRLAAFGRALRLHKLQMPTLIGVNDNERRAKQFVIVDVEVDKYNCWACTYNGLEHFVVKEMEASSFETLEALGTHLSNKMLQYLRIFQQGLLQSPAMQVKISMEKPTALPFADCPVVEVRADAPVDTEAEARQA